VQDGCCRLAGVLQVIKYPTTGAPFPNGVIPPDRFNPYGQAVLNFLPLPNISGNPSFNYTSQFTGSISALPDHTFKRLERCQFRIRGDPFVQLRNKRGALTRIDAGLAGGVDEVRTADRAELGADEDGGASVGARVTFALNVSTFGAH